MKKLLFASIIIFAISCKKETPEPTPVSPVVVADTANFFIMDGDGHASDTFTLHENQQCHFMPSGTYLYMSAYNNTAQCGSTIMPQCTAPGTYHIIEHLPSMATSINASGVSYYCPDVTVTVKRFGQIGGNVNCNYSGTFKKQSDTTVVITVSGNFNVTRGSDL